MLGTTAAIIALILGIVLLSYSSDKAVEHSVSIASALKISPLMIGLVLASIGTDLPEIANSITSSALGHGDINAGDSLGSVLTQITLVLGLLPFLGGKFKVKRKEIVVIGVCEVSALLFSVLIFGKGYVSRLEALFLVASWPIFMFIIGKVMANGADEKKPKAPAAYRGHSYHLMLAFLGYAGVAVGAYAVIQSVIALSAAIKIPEYIISFFIVAIGTSLPELVVDLTAIRKKQYELAIGDAVGSCIVDAVFSIGIGQLLFPTPISGGLVRLTGSYAILASIIVISTLALRGKVDRKAGALFIGVYLLSYLTLYV